MADEKTSRLLKTCWNACWQAARRPVEGVRVIETLNGGSRGNENAMALDVAGKHGYKGVGGSDAHIVSHVGRCATRFEDDIADMTGLVAALEGGRFEAVTPTGPS